MFRSHVRVLAAASLIGTLVAASSGVAQTLPPGLSSTEISLDDLSAFADPTANWHLAGGAIANPEVEGHIRPAEGTGVLVNIPEGDANGHLFTSWEHGDLDLDVDVMLARGANSGIYLQGRYEVQLFDSWSNRDLGFGDIGGIYQRYDASRPEGQQGYQGSPPRTNAARAPGLWQHLHIEFRAPRFDAEGRKIEDARFVRVELNGVVVQEDVAVTGPTRAAAFDDERPLGPLMIQGNLGRLAIRNIRYKRYDRTPPALKDVSYSAYEGEFHNMQDLLTATPARSGETDELTWEVVNRRDNYGVVFDATFPAPVAGTYQFALVCEGGCRVDVGGEPVVGAGNPGQGWTNQAETVHLAAGDHPIRVSYFKSNRWWRPTLGVYVEGPGFARVPLHKEVIGRYRTPNPIYAEVQREPRMLRSFVEHGGEKLTHAISVGSPSGAHYSYDLNSGTLLRVWRGDFLDVTEMWHERGEPQLAVARGSTIDFGREPLLVTGDAGGPASEAEAALSLTYEGYSIDADGYPVYRYADGPLTLTDHLAPAPDGREITRTISVNGPADALWLRLALAPEIEPLGQSTYLVGDHRYYIQLGDETADAVVVRHRDGRQELMVQVPADAASVSYAVRW